MQNEKKMMYLRFDDNNLEFDFLLGLSIWLPAIIFVYCLPKFLLQLLTHYPPNVSQPKEGEIEISKNKISDASQAEYQQVVLYRFRQRKKKIQREETRKKGNRVSKAPGLCDGDLVHFSHRHPLLRIHLRGTEVIRCNMCTIIIAGVAYGCDHCHYFLHERSKVENELVDVAEKRDSGNEIHYVACGYDNSYPHHSLFAFYYHCDLCKFDHLECDSFMTTLIPKCATEEELGVIGDHSFLSEVQKSLVLQRIYLIQQPKLRHLGEVIHFNHRHPLKAIKQMNEVSIMSCSICSIYALSSYICQLWSYFIDESCFLLPQNIYHHFYPNHPLVLGSYIDHPKFKFLLAFKKMVHHIIARLVNSVSIIAMLVPP
ncbi:hypothetical protein P3S67_028660 [Capsicum chacoense]